MGTMKEHPFLVTTTFIGDGVTIQYDITQPGRSDAVGKAFKINADGKGELVGDGDAFDGKVLEVDDDHKFTGAYLFGGLLLPIGTGETVARGDKLVGALGPNDGKGYVRAVTPPSDPTDAADLQAVIDSHDGKGQVLEVDATHVLLAYPG